MKVSKQEEIAVKKLVDKVMRYGLDIPVIMFLEGFKPMSFIGSQAMLVFSPILKFIHSFESYDQIQKLLEKREGIEYIIREIETRVNSKSVKK